MTRKLEDKVPFLEFGEVLVTGGTGFIGTRVCRALLARGWMPRLLVREGSEGKLPLDIRHRCRITLGDVTDRESVINAAQSTDAIVHLVGIIREDAEKGVTFDRLHVEATANVIAAAQFWKIRRLVHMSALGAEAGSPVGYLDSKGRAERLVRGSGLGWTIFRPSIVFGEGDGFLMPMLDLVAKAPVVPVAGDGRYELQPVWVGDVARGIAEAVSREASVGAIYEVGGLERFSFDALLDEAGASVGRTHVRKLHVPLPLMRAGVGMLSGFAWSPMTPDMLAMLLRGSVCDPASFRTAFGSHMVSLREFLSCRLRGGMLPLRAIELEEEPVRAPRKAA